MTDRRQFLASLAALPMTTVAGYQPHLAALPTALSIPCPDPTPGSVTNPVGSVAGTSLTDLVDAYSQIDGVDWQHQLYSLLTNERGVCAHYRQNQTVANEQWLLVIQIAYRADQQPAPFATGTYQIGVGTTDPSGTLRTVAGTSQSHGTNCSQGREREATGGTITYTTVTDTLVEASYDLQFRRDRVQGSFSAPMCLLCSPRPTSRACLDEPL